MIELHGKAAAAGAAERGGAGKSHEHVGAVHRAADRDDSADGGTAAVWACRLSAAAGRSLPNVNFPTVQVTAQLPGADPQTMASSVATPLEQQFSPNTRADAAHLLERARLHPAFGAVRPEPRRRQRGGRRAGGDQRGEPVPAAEHAVSADHPQSEPGGHADPGARADVRFTAADDRRRLCGEHPAAEDLADLRRRPGRHRRPAEAVRSACRSIRRRWPTAASAWKMYAPCSARPMSISRRARSTARGKPTRSTPTISCCKPEAYNDLIIAYRNGSPVRIRDVGHAVSGAGEQPARRLVQQPARHPAVGPARARRQRDRDRRSDQGAAAAARRLRFRRPSSCRSFPIAHRPSGPRSPTCRSR